MASFRAIGLVCSVSAVLSGPRMLSAQDAGQLEDVPAGTVILKTLEEFRALIGEEAFNRWEREGFDAARPGHRAQVDARIKSLEAMSREQIIESLYEWGEEKNEAHFAGLDGWGGGCVKVRSCLSDRRVRRLYDILQSLPAEESKEVCREMFETAFQLSNEKWNTFFEYCDLPNDAPRKPLGAHSYVLESVILMNAIFGDSADVLSQLDRWRLVNVPRLVRAALRDGELGPRYRCLRDNGQPDDLYAIHVLMILAERRGRLTAENLSAAHALGLPEIREYKMLTFRAPADVGLVLAAPQEDFVVREFSLTPDSVMLWSGFYAWNVQHYLRSLLMQPEGASAELEPTPAEPDSQ